MSMPKRLHGPTLVLVLILGVGSAARSQQAKPLGEADLAQLVELQVGDEVVVARVEKSGVGFAVDPAALDRLRKAGASEPILAAVKKAGKPADAITYEGVLRLVRQGVPEADILKRLQDSPTTFTLDRAQVAGLEGAGASKRLVGAMQQLRNSPSLGSDITDLAVVLDCSGSMKELTPDGQSKMDAAKHVLTRFINEIPNGKRLALIVYGTRPTNVKELSCRDVTVVQGLVPLDDAAKARLTRYIDAIRPMGATPLSLALETAGRELARSEGLCQLVAITDGMETCGGDPGHVAGELARRANLPHGVDIVGFGVSAQEQTAVREIVTRAGRGKYYDAQTAHDLGKALKAAEREASERARAAAERRASEQEAEMARRDADAAKLAKKMAEEADRRDREQLEAKAEMPPAPKKVPERVVIKGHTNEVLAVAFSADSRVLATGGRDKTIRLWDAATHERIALIRHTDPVYALAFTRDGKTLASGDLAGNIVLWDVASGARTGMIETKARGVLLLAFAPDGKTLAVLPRGDQNIVQLWDIPAGTLGVTLKGHAGAITNMVFAPDGTFLATSSDDESVRIWDPATGMERDSLKGHDGPVAGLAVSPDGRRLASGGYKDKTVTVWDVAKGNAALTLEGPAGVTFVGYASDGKTVLAYDRGTLVTLWFLPKRKEWYHFQWRDRIPQYNIMRLHDANNPAPRPSSMYAYALDGSALAVGDGDDVALWHLSGGGEPLK